MCHEAEIDFYFLNFFVFPEGRQAEGVDVGSMPIAECVFAICRILRRVIQLRYFPCLEHNM